MASGDGSVRALGERGAVVVEAALVTPLLMALLLGIIEMALLMKDDVALTSAVRNGGRTASANAGAGPGRCQRGWRLRHRRARRPTRRCSPRWRPTPSSAPAARCPRTRSWSCGSTRPTTRATPVPPTARDGDDLRRQLREVQVGAQPRTSSATSAARGPPRRVNACANNNPDAVGIYMQAKHDFVTGFFGNDVDIEDHAVFAFEPLPDPDLRRRTRRATHVSPPQARRRLRRRDEAGLRRSRDRAARLDGLHGHGRVRRRHRAVVRRGGAGAEGRRRRRPGRRHLHAERPRQRPDHRASPSATRNGYPELRHEPGDRRASGEQAQRAQGDHHEHDRQHLRRLPRHRQDDHRPLGGGRLHRAGADGQPVQHLRQRAAQPAGAGGPARPDPRCRPRRSRTAPRTPSLLGRHRGAQTPTRSRATGS